jgi:hypothetical protein
MAEKLSSKDEKTTRKFQVAQRLMMLRNALLRVLPDADSSTKLHP